METALLDAAFRLVSHSITSIEGRLHALTTDEARLAELRRQFPQVDPQVLQEGYARARQLGEVAIELADAARNQRTALDAQTLADRCPGFSGGSYSWAINDGFTRTRK